MVDGCTSSVFSGSEFLNNGHLAWKSLVNEHEGRDCRETEAKRVRFLLNHLRLDHRTNGYECCNHFRRHVKRLNELQSASSKSTHVDVIIAQITHPDHEHVVETLKGVEELTLCKCYFQVINKAADLEKLTENSITPRKAKMHMPNHNESEPISLEKHAQPNGFVKLPYELCERLNPQQNDELRAHNKKGSELRKRKLDRQETSTVLPSLPVIMPRDMSVAPVSKKLRKEDLLRDM